ncbi:unnamed protein product, partial [Ectocarpus fasciculatus]
PALGPVGAPALLATPLAATGHLACTPAAGRAGRCSRPVLPGMGTSSCQSCCIPPGRGRLHGLTPGRSSWPCGPVLPALLPGAASFGARCRGPCLVTVSRRRAGMRPDPLRPHRSRFAHTRSLPALSRLRLQGDRLVASRPGVLFRWTEFTIICAPR